MGAPWRETAVHRTAFSLQGDLFSSTADETRQGAHQTADG